MKRFWNHETGQMIYIVPEPEPRSMVGKMPLIKPPMLGCRIRNIQLVVTWLLSFHVKPRVFWSKASLLVLQVSTTATVVKNCFCLTGLMYTCLNVIDICELYLVYSYDDIYIYCILFHDLIQKTLYSLQHFHILNVV